VDWLEIGLWRGRQGPALCLFACPAQRQAAIRDSLAFFLDYLNCALPIRRSSLEKTSQSWQQETEKMEAIQGYLPFLIPVILLQLGLMVFALLDLIRREKTRGPKWLWAIVIVLGELLGPILYLLIGREE
jgi:hypothetical protein